MEIEKESHFLNPIKLKHIRGVDEIFIAGNCAAGFTFFLISDLKYILWQHIRDLNTKEISRLMELTPFIHTVLTGLFVVFFCFI